MENNPVREIRLREGFKDVGEFAETLGVNYKKVLSGDSGTSIRLSDELVVAIKEKFGDDEDNLKEVYENWRENKNIEYEERKEKGGLRGTSGETFLKEEKEVALQGGELEVENPIKKIRAQEGYKTIKEMAIAFGVSYNSIYNAEQGMNVNLSTKLKVPLEIIGYDFDDVEEDYRKWRLTFRI